MARDITPQLREVAQLNRLCHDLRDAYLAAHPDAPRTAREREWEELRRQLELELVRRRRGRVAEE